MNMQAKDLGALPRWDLSNIYPGLQSEPFVQSIADLRMRLDEIDAFMADHRIAREADTGNRDHSAVKTAIDGYLGRMNALLRLYGTLNAYVTGHVATNSYDTTAKRLLSELDLLGVRLQQQSLRFQAWLGSVAAALPFISELDGPARAHTFFLRETAEQSRYLMSDREEALAAELALSGENAWSKLQGTVCSQLTVDFERDGKTERLPMTALQNLHRHDADPDVRRRAYVTELAAWKSVREPLAAALNGVKGAASTLNRRRGRVDALHASIDQSRIDRETLETLIGAMQDSFPMFRRYLRAKARRLGHAGALPWWDIFAPIGRPERRYTWPETEDLVVAQFGTFSNRLADLARRAFANRWIDAEPRDGKEGGAFCMKVLGVSESRILCNFDYSFDLVSTVAHELGHAFHNDCQVGKTPLQIVTPMTLAETASIFCETIITEAALAAASSPDEELAILEAFLIGATQVIVDITSRFLFEQEVFTRRVNSELSADDFCEIMVRFQKATYGEGLDENFLHPYMWAWKPHYYGPRLSFYNYPYAFGLLFGLGLYAIYRERGASFVPQYEELLASTGEADAAALAMRFGIDIRKPEFWQSSLSIIEQRIERYLQL